MSNSHFNFKQFSVHQDMCSMKVGTDGVLLGAWTNTENANRILDIGTGTGLIALMLAQRTDATIVAVDAEENACNQATINFNASPWKERLSIIHSKIQDYQTDEKFDLIVSNPPYFTGYYSSDDLSRDVARSADVLLPYEDLITAAKRLLKDTGRISLILPADQQGKLVNIALEKGFVVSRCTKVMTKTGKEHKRVLLELINSDGEVELFQDELIIQTDNSGRAYTQEYIKLTKDFYLAF